MWLLSQPRWADADWEDAAYAVTGMPRDIADAAVPAAQVGSSMEAAASAAQVLIVIVGSEFHGF